VENYFNYFTEIEEHFQRRRGSILLLSTLDWALIETWREAGIPSKPSSAASTPPSIATTRANTAPRAVSTALPGALRK
jgi:hypothetical protein